MKFRKYALLLIGGGIALVLGAAMAFLLFRLQAGHSKLQNDLQAAQGRLQRLADRKPTPTDENVAAAQRALSDLQLMYGDMEKGLREGQREPAELEPAEFGPLLERTSRLLQRAAVTNQVMLPERFAFGFTRYTAGELPDKADVARLVLQLRNAEALCTTLFDAHISQLLAVERAEFELAGAELRANAEGVAFHAPEQDVRIRRQAPVTRATTAGPAPATQLSEVPQVPESPLFGTERYRIAFTAREDAAWKAINALVRGRPLTVIRDVVLETQRGAEVTDAIKPLNAPAAGTISTNAVGLIYPPRDERIVAGREEVKVDLIVDVYRFLNAAKEEKP